MTAVRKTEKIKEATSKPSSKKSRGQNRKTKDKPPNQHKVQKKRSEKNPRNKKETNAQHFSGIAAPVSPLPYQPRSPRPRRAAAAAAELRTQEVIERESIVPATRAFQLEKDLIYNDNRGVPAEDAIVDDSNHNGATYMMIEDPTGKVLEAEEGHLWREMDGTIGYQLCGVSKGEPVAKARKCSR